ncbi:MAG: riboflavin synthase [Acidobacteriota bacterium]|nr:riboflavin synthase [Acidobacteriota bacterium]
MLTISDMFTGLIEEVGRIRRLALMGAGGELQVEAREVLDGLRVGESIAVNGVCLTVTEVERNGFRAQLSAETLRRTTFGQLRPGRLVNLERALRVSDRLGGHIVQGHVDGIGRLLERRPEGESWIFRFAFPQDLRRYLVIKGSIAVDGISLTVAGLSETWFEVAIIPHTLRMTNLRELHPGDGVNLEVDVLAKYIERMMEPMLAHVRSKLSGITFEQLKAEGYAE